MSEKDENINKKLAEVTAMLESLHGSAKYRHAPENLSKIEKSPKNLAPNEKVPKNVPMTSENDVKPPMSLLRAMFIIVLSLFMYSLCLMLGWNYVLVDSVTFANEISFLDSVALYGLFYVILASLPSRR